MIQSTLIKWFNGILKIPFLLSFIAVVGIISDYGILKPQSHQEILFSLYITTLILSVIINGLKFLVLNDKPKFKTFVVDFLLLVLLILILFHHLDQKDFGFFNDRVWLHVGVFLVFIREVSLLNFVVIKEKLNPAQLFVFSFFAIILIGTILLMLPKSTYTGINFVDALFTSTSAVCVTGLIVVDTGTYFTHFGQVILILLMQIGGLGIMTFASFFSYFFKGFSSYKNQLMLSDMNNSNKIAEVFSILKKIIVATFIIEAIGAFFIFRSIDSTIITSVEERLFFAVFHTVSGFCNAGFSTLTNNLYEVGFRLNYSLHLIIAVLIILGGIGFPIIFNLFKYIKHLFKNRLNFLTLNKKSIHIPWVININTKLVVITTALLLFFGTLFFYLFETNHALANLSGLGKIIESFFGAVTPRTAGFNTINMSTLQKPTILLVIFLMWVGASPASTGGGIKTSTFAIAILTIFSVARQKKDVEVFHREIANVSIKRAFTVISLSIIVIGFSVILISLFDGKKELTAIIFECVSAFSTVGLSLGITESLTSLSKLTLIVTMFVGRVGMLTLLLSFLKKTAHKKYRHAKEEILIN